MKQFRVVDANDASGLEERLNQAAKEGFEFLTALPFSSGRMAAILVREENTPASKTAS